MQLKVFLNWKTLKNPLVWAKKSKKTQRNPKKPQKSKKTKKTNWAGFKKKRVFSNPAVGTAVPHHLPYRMSPGLYKDSSKRQSYNLGDSYIWGLAGTLFLFSNFSYDTYIIRPWVVLLLGIVSFWAGWVTPASGQIIFILLGRGRGAGRGFEPGAAVQQPSALIT